MKPAIRISLGIVALSTSLLLVADALVDIFPDPNIEILESRIKLSESLAIQYSALIDNDRLVKMKPSMDQTVTQLPDMLSMGLRTADGNLLARTSEHDQLWDPSDQKRSSPTHVRIQIFRGDHPWGTLEMRFEALAGAGVFAVLNTPLYKLLGIMAAAGFFAYLLYLSRTLKYLDPSTVVPGRVRAALDQLVEGAFILDDEQHIVLVNTAFAKKVDRTPEALLGVNPSTLAWVKGNIKGPMFELPWVAAMHDGARRTDIRLELESPKLGLRILSSNVSPIIDGAGKRRGVLATFDDISESERMNEKLRETLETLEVAHTEVREKNEELFRLATIDPLTGIFNRRAFFERLQLEFDLAVRDGLELSVVMADIDHFKSINDDLGHGVGDVVIKQMAQVLEDSSRANDCVGRYGGEEFCILMVNADAEIASQVSDRARLAFAQGTEANNSPTAGRKVTASFGVSTVKLGASDIAELLNQADLALYESKHGGRNRVSTWTQSDTQDRRAS